MDTLFARQGKLLLKFGGKCTILPQTKELFPLNNKNHSMTTRNHQKYEVLHAHTSRIMNSTVPYIQRLLNMEENDKA